MVGDGLVTTWAVRLAIARPPVGLLAVTIAVLFPTVAAETARANWQLPPVGSGARQPFEVTTKELASAPPSATVIAPVLASPAFATMKVTGLPWRPATP